MERKAGFSLGVALLATLIGGGRSAPAQERKEASVTQAEWAVYLSQGTGLYANLPPPLLPERLIAILSNWSYRRIEAEDYQRASPNLAMSKSEEFGEFSQRGWMKTEKDVGKLTYQFEIPVRRRYLIQGSVRGGNQIWKIDREKDIVITPENKFSRVKIGEIWLDAGQHTITVSLPRGGGLDLIELLTRSAPPIEPAGGFESDQALTFGDKATTLIRAINAEDRLPVDDGYHFTIEAEQFERAEGKYLVTDDPAPGKASGKRWVKADGAIRCRYRFSVPQDGLYSISVRGVGDQEEIWDLDQQTSKVISRPDSPRAFAWFQVETVLLKTGEHSLNAKIPAGNGIDVIQVVRRRSDPGSYIELLSELGFREGTIPPREPGEDKRRYAPFLLVEAEQFLAVDGKARNSTATNFGPVSGKEWMAGPDEGAPAVLRYEVEIPGTGLYALYMKSLGTGAFTWTVVKEKAYRKTIKAFPSREAEFAWQEVATFELKEGKHTVEAALPAGAGFDCFELRRCGRSQSQLEALAETEVTKDEAERNAARLALWMQLPEKPVTIVSPERPVTEESGTSSIFSPVNADDISPVSPYKP